MKYELLIDATGDNCELFLIVDNYLKDQVKQTNNRNLTYSLVVYVQQILSANSLDASELTSLYLVYGPGKFSATRTSAILAKTFKMQYPKIRLLILDKFHYLASDNTLVVLKSDANKYFVNYFKNSLDKLRPQLVNFQELQALIEINPTWNIVNEDNNKLDVTKTLNKFYEADEYFVLEYFKPPC